jgi:Tol biopolymer transport system component
MTQGMATTAIRRAVAAVIAAVLVTMPLDLPVAGAAEPGTRNGRLVYLALNPDSESSASWDLYGINPDGSGRHRLTATGDVGEPTWSPNGRRIAYTRHGQGIWVMRADGSGKRQLIPNPRVDMMPAWSPDGRKIAFVSARRSSTLQLYVHNLRTGGTRRLTSAGGPWREAYDPSWSPDSRRIAFSRRRVVDSTRFDQDIFTIRADGSRLRRRTATRQEETRPAWSPDGRRVLFERPSATPKRRLLLSMRPDGSRVRQIAELVCPEMRAAWSPDGAHIALTGALTTGPVGLVTISADGTVRREVTRDQGRDPAWQPLP